MATKRVTQAELEALVERAQELGHDLLSTDKRLRDGIGYEDDVTTPAAFARSFSALSARASDLSHAILIKLSLAEDRKLIEAQLLARTEA